MYWGSSEWARILKKPYVPRDVHKKKTKKGSKKGSGQPESNQWPRDISCNHLQSPALPTELYPDIQGFLSCTLPTTTSPGPEASFHGKQQQPKI